MSMTIIRATQTFSTYVKGSLVSVHAGQTVSLPKANADALVGGKLATYLSEEKAPENKAHVQVPKSHGPERHPAVPPVDEESESTQADVVKRAANSEPTGGYVSGPAPVDEVSGYDTQHPIVQAAADSEPTGGYVSGPAPVDVPSGHDTQHPIVKANAEGEVSSGYPTPEEAEPRVPEPPAAETGAAGEVAQQAPHSRTDGTDNEGNSGSTSVFKPGDDPNRPSQEKPTDDSTQRPAKKTPAKKPAPSSSPASSTGKRTPGK